LTLTLALCPLREKPPHVDCRLWQGSCHRLSSFHLRQKVLLKKKLNFVIDHFEIESVIMTKWDIGDWDTECDDTRGL